MKKAAIWRREEIGIRLRETRGCKLLRFGFVALVLCLVLSAQCVFAQDTQKYLNGLWFNGQTFEQRTVYVVDGFLRLQHDGNVNATIDLHGRFVITPFAEAHNHHFGEETNFQQQLKLYLRQGIFYSKNTNNLTKLATAVRKLVNQPDSADVLYANGGLTASGGHPVQIYDVMSQQLAGWTKKDMEDQAYFVIDTNALGYQLLNHARIADAIEIFKLNVEMFPNGSNTYDSLGEAYLRNNDRDRAIKNYKKSLELNPKNANAIEVLKRIE